MRRMFSTKQMQEAISYYYAFNKVALNEDYPEVIQLGIPLNNVGVVGNFAFDGIDEESNFGINFNGGEGFQFHVDSNGAYINNLPTTDPQVAGQLWNDNGTLKISAGE